MKRVNSGQALLLVLVGMGTAMVLVLSIVSRSITDISLSSKDDQAARAFSAAEAGIERLLVGASLNGKVPLGNNSFVTGEKFDLAFDETSYNVPEGIVSGAYATIWFVSHSNEGKLALPVSDVSTLKVCWGNENYSPDSDYTPALELSIYYDETHFWSGPAPDFSGIKIFRAAFDPNTTSETRTNNGFIKANVITDCTVNDQKYPFSIEVTTSTLPNDVLFARAKLLYNDIPQNVGFVVTGATLPSQGKRIVSVGTSGGEGGSTRKIEVLQTYKDVLPFIDTALFSGGNLTK